MAISALELRHIIESGFLPMRCKCSATADGELTLDVVDPETGASAVMAGIPIASLNTSRAIADLIAQVRLQVRSSLAARCERHASF